MKAKENASRIRQKLTDLSEAYLGLPLRFRQDKAFKGADMYHVEVLTPTEVHIHIGCLTFDNDTGRVSSNVRATTPTLNAIMDQMDAKDRL